MKRANFHLTEDQMNRLAALSKETGLSMAELIRRAIDGYLERPKKPRKDR